MVGLETHIELSTDTKIFCSCSTKFGAKPNSHCCPICLGFPGVLPTLNKKVVNYAIMAGLSTNCEISRKSYMDRKNYVYPDLSKAYQISQFDVPLCRNGFIKLSNGKKIRIKRIHIEEDAGKLVYGKDGIFIDYNRAGVPLIEVVTEPDFADTEEIKEYLETLRLTMKYLKISDCKMQEGSMRCDVNVSVMDTDNSKNYPRTEIKNMNSISMISKAVNSEFRRQVNCIENGKTIIQQTLKYNEEKNITTPMRDKENSDDYRYFREPDLTPIRVTESEISSLKTIIPELPNDKLNRYINDYQLNKKEAAQIVRYPKVAELFEYLIQETGDEKLSANVILTHIFRYFPDDSSKENFDLPIDVSEFSKVINMVNDKVITLNNLKKVIDKMLSDKKGFDELFDKSEFSQIPDDELEEIVKRVIDDNIQAVSDYLNGKTKALAALLGMVMRETKGRADPLHTEEILKNNLRGCV